MTPKPPAGFSVRPPTLADVPEVAALIDGCRLAHGVHADGTETELSIYWTQPDRDLENEDWLVIAPDRRVAGYLQLYAYEPFTTFEFEAYVHPAHTGRGVGAFLLEMIEVRCRRDVNRAPVGERVTLLTEVLDANAGGRELLERFGFCHIRDDLRMQVDFDGAPPAPSWPDGISTRRLVRGQDERAVYELLEGAFADVWGHVPTSFEEFVQWRIDVFQDFDPSLWILAEDGGRLAGAALGRGGRTAESDIAWVGMLGVAREYRGRGLGMAMLHEAFGEFYRRGKRGAGLSVDGASLTGADRLYRRAGMRVVQRNCLYEKELRPAAGG